MSEFTILAIYFSGYFITFAVFYWEDNSQPAIDLLAALLWFILVPCLAITKVIDKIKEQSDE